MPKNRGFTLIELMIVIAIIGIIASIASVQYQNYIIKSKVIASLAEIGAGKVNFQARLNEGVSSVNPADIGLATQTNHCIITVDANGIHCQLVSAPAAIATATASWSYDNTTDSWQCNSSGISTNYKPSYCN